MSDFDSAMRDYSEAAWHHKTDEMRAAYVVVRDLFAKQFVDAEACRARLEVAQQMAEALKAIARLDPETDSKSGFNEWGEAECFRMTQELASAALAEWEKQ